MQAVVAQEYAVRFMVADHVFQQRNELEDVTYDIKPGDILLEGTLGERWPVPAAKVVKKYVFPDGSDINLATVAAGVWHEAKTRRCDDICWCMFVPLAEGSCQVETGEGDVLTCNRPGIDHADGDYIFMGDNNGQPEPAWGAWVVNGAVFRNTYSFAEEN